MPILRKARRAIRKVIFGDTLLPHGITLGFVEPQSEIAVRLHGLGDPIDVTERHSMACANPLTVCIALDRDETLQTHDGRRLSLTFAERAGQQRKLGEIRLRLAGNISVDGSDLSLFEARSSKNYCLPQAQLWAHDLLRAYRNWRRTDASALKMTLGGMRAMAIMFIRPHPVVLVSHDHAGGNIFPMNLMGNLGKGLFTFALVDSRAASVGVERATRIALSSVPVAQAALAFQLAPNHFRQSIDWGKLPFGMRRSSAFCISIPAFAQRVREVEIVSARTLGSHRFFVGRVISEQRLADCETLHLIEGIYQAWRLKGRTEELNASLAADSLNKQGIDTSRFAAAPNIRSKSLKSH